MSYGPSKLIFLAPSIKWSHQVKYKWKLGANQGRILRSGGRRTWPANVGEKSWFLRFSPDLSHLQQEKLRKILGNLKKLVSFWGLWLWGFLCPKDVQLACGEGQLESKYSRKLPRPENLDVSATVFLYFFFLNFPFYFLKKKKESLF